jgi:CRP-like cAMP-binding protein
VTHFQNQILASLSAEEQSAMSADLTPMVFTPGAILQRQNEVRACAYFPDGGLIALKRTLSDGSVAASAMVGREGMLGSPLGAVWRPSPDQAVVQIIGAGHRISTDRLVELSLAHAGLRKALANYAEWIAEEARQTAVCNALHTVGLRLPKWLLLCADRVGRDRLPLTQEFMGDMLGVQRTSVTLALRGLVEAGLVRTGRSVVEIVDRPGLMRHSCVCYRPGRDLAGAADLGLRASRATARAC